MTHDDHTATQSSRDEVHVKAFATVRIHDRAIHRVRAELFGGRDRYSVGGEIKEGLRWWHGHLHWPDEQTPPRAGTEVLLELDHGRSAPAVTEPAPAEPEGTTSIHGIGPPPFDVP